MTLSAQDDAKITAYLAKNPPQSALTDDDHSKIDAYLQSQKQGQYKDLLQSIVSKTPDIPNDIKDVAQGTVQGALNLGDLFNQLLTAPINALTGKKLQAPDVSHLADSLGSGRNNTESQVANAIGQYNPAMLGLDELKAGAGATSILGKLLSSQKKGVSSLSHAILDALGGATSGAANQGRGNRGIGALEGAGANLLPHAVIHGMSAADPMNWLKSPLSSKELQANVNAAKGTKTSLGDVISNPYWMRKYKNVLPTVPFSGAAHTIQETQQQVQKNAQNIVGNIMGTTSPDGVNSQITTLGKEGLKHALGAPENLDDIEGKTNNEGHQMLNQIFGKSRPSDIPKEAFDKLNQIEKIATVDKENLYRQRNKIAEKDPNFQMNANKFADLANSKRNEIASTTMLKNESSEKNIFNRLANYTHPDEVSEEVSPIVDANGKKIIHTKVTKPTLEEAQFLRNKLYETSRNYGRGNTADDRHAAGVYNSLAKALGEDMDDSIAASKNPKLRKAQNIANENYKESYLPLLDKDVFQYLRGKGDSDKFIDTFLKSGDRVNQLSKLTKISPEFGNLLAKHYFGDDAINNRGELDHKVLAKKIDKIPINMLHALVPDAADREQLFNYKNKSDLTDYLSKDLKGNGTFDTHDMVNRIENLLVNPAKARRLIPDEETRNHLQRFVDLSRKYDVFKKAMNEDGHINQGALSKIRTELAKDQAQFNRIVPKSSDRNAMRNQQILQRMNPTSDNPMHNPSNGQKLKDFMPDILSVLGLVLGGGDLKGIAGAGVGLALSAGLGHAQTKFLTSEAVRNKVVESLLKGKNQGLTKDQMRVMQAIMQTLVNQKGS